MSSFYEDELLPVISNGVLGSWVGKLTDICKCEGICASKLALPSNVSTTITALSTDRTSTNPRERQRH